MTIKMSLITGAAAAFAITLSTAVAQPTPAPAPAAVSAPTASPAPGRGGGRGPVDLGIDRPAAEALFGERCKGCHEPPVDRAPSRQQLGQRTADSIVAALTRGPMTPMAQGLSTAQVQALAVHLAGRRMGVAVPVTTTDVMCAAHPAIRMTSTSWASFGNDPENTRYQPNPGLRLQDIPRLKVKWAFSYRGGTFGQPTVVGDRLFITSRGGQFYSLDAKTGCVHWRMDGVGSRTTPMIVRRPDISPSGWVSFIGVGRRVVAVDAQDGKEIWRTNPEIETHGSSSITGTPILHGDQLFVPLSSGEEASGVSPAYACCTFRGSIVALNAKTGQVQWKTHTVDEPLRPTRRNANGVQLQGPAGGAIWSAPTVDAKRGVIYVATGDSYTEVDTEGADAIMAIDMATGAKRWVNQVTENDNFLVNCDTKPGTVGIAENEIRGLTRLSTNCPQPTGPDFDFGAAPILRTLPDGRQILLSGQKSGIVYGMDPDTGRTLWHTKVGAGSTLGGIEWGIAADDRYVYAPNSDMIAPRSIARPGLTALEIATGKVAWYVPAPKVSCHYAGANRQDRGCYNSQSQAPAVMPGAVFSGTVDGHFRAYSTANGRILWDFDTTGQTYKTVNGVAAQPGGSMDGMGPAIAGGMVYVMSGYGGSANVGGNPLNVLLAFSVDGK